MSRPHKRLRLEAPKPRCLFLEIPIEIRFQIYNYTLAETADVTISVAKLERNIFDNGEPESTLEGLPGWNAPLVRFGFDPEMLRLGSPKTIPVTHLLDADVGPGTSIDSGYASAGSSFASATSTRSLDNSNRPTLQPLTTINLLLTNKQIYDEFISHIRHPTAAQSTLHVTFPYGVIVLEKLYPGLVRHAKKICISGFYDGAHSTQYPPPRSCHLPRACTTDTHLPLPSELASARRNGPALPYVSKETHLAAAQALQRLTHQVLSHQGHPTLKSLETRIFYPGADRYSLVWGCDDSPIVTVLRNTCGGKFDMKVWRGRYGNGVIMSVKPSTDARIVSTVWRKCRSGKEAEAWESFGDLDRWDRVMPEDEDGSLIF